MPYNYTVSTFNFTEALQDAVYAGNMITGGSVIITPNSGYVVSASEFTIAGSLPPQYASITFTDSAVAGEIGNTVIVTFVFSELFEMSSAANNINLPISGHAALIDDKRQISFDIDFIDNTTENVNGRTSVTGSYDAGTTGSPIEITNVLSANVAGNPGIDANNNIIIATVLLSADTIAQGDSADYHFDDNATISVENAPVGASFSLTPDLVVSTNDDDQVVSRFYRLKLNSDVSIPSGLNCKVFIHYQGVSDRETITTSKKEIKEVIYGSPEISMTGCTKIIKIIGDVGAEFDLTITPKGSTILNSNLAQAAPQGIIYQYINPTITLDTDAGTNYTVTSKTTIAYKGRPNKKPSSLKHIKTVKEKFSFTYVYTRSGGHTFTRADLPVWSMTDASSDWDQNVTDHGNVIQIFNIAIARTAGNTVATGTGDVVIKKVGTANVTFNLDSSEFLTSA